jgi:hypothetical protein
MRYRLEAVEIHQRTLKGDQAARDYSIRTNRVKNNFRAWPYVEGVIFAGLIATTGYVVVETHRQSAQPMATLPTTEECVRRFPDESDPEYTRAWCMNTISRYERMLREREQESR